MHFKEQKVKSQRSGNHPRFHLWEPDSHDATSFTEKTRWFHDTQNHATLPLSLKPSKLTKTQERAPNDTMTAEKKSYAVWVGSLSKEIIEEDLFDAFKCYGPICNVRITKDKQGKSRGFGFVNFYSKEVAEVAANDMDDTEIRGSIIKANFKDETKKAKDLRPLTDCDTFIKRRPCQAGKVQYYYY